VHRFGDPTYAQLSLSMRTGTPNSPGMVFDALLARGEVRIYPTPAARTQALAAIAAAATATRATGWNGHGGGVLLVADTRAQVADLNGSIRERLVAGGHVDDTHVLTTWAGERIGVGDQIATRRNDRDADVANRDTWTVTGLRTDGAAVVAGSRGERVLPAAYVRHHVELAYASTVYGAQGATTDAAHLVVGEHTGAAAAYVAMTRGRDHNTAHLVADTPQAARDQWIEVFSRDRADLGPAHAARPAAQGRTSSSAARRPGRGTACTNAPAHCACAFRCLPCLSTFLLPRPQGRRRAIPDDGRVSQAEGLLYRPCGFPAHGRDLGAELARLPDALEAVDA